MMTTMTNLNWSTASHKTILDTNTTLLVFYSKKLEGGDNSIWLHTEPEAQHLAISVKKTSCYQIIRGTCKKVHAQAEPRSKS